jgi:hypothetical protein
MRTIASHTVTRTLRKLSKILLRQARARRNVLRWLVAIVSLALAARYLVRHQDELSFVLDLDWRILVPVLAANLAYLGLKAWRFLVILRQNGLDGASFPAWFRIFVIAAFLNKWIPQAGNVYRGVRLKADHGFSYAGYVSSYASSAWLSTILDLALALGLTVVLEPTLQIGRWRAPWAIGAALAVVIGGPILGNLLLSRVHVQESLLARVHSVLSQVVSGAVEMARDVRFVSRVSVLGGLAFLATAAQFRLVMQAFGISVSVPVVAVFTCLRRTSQLLILSPGNLGVQEMAYGFLGAAVGIGAAPGIVASGVSRVVAYFVNTILAAALGGLGLLRPKANERP